ncbi:hypothetical protein HDU76_010580, partial [Blyttiomyces sp. JEL0837]
MRQQDSNCGNRITTPSSVTTSKAAFKKPNVADAAALTSPSTKTFAYTSLPLLSSAGSLPSPTTTESGAPTTPVTARTPLLSPKVRMTTATTTPSQPHPSSRDTRPHQHRPSRQQQQHQPTNYGRVPSDEGYHEIAGNNDQDDNNNDDCGEDLSSGIIVNGALDGDDHDDIALDLVSRDIAAVNEAIAKIGMGKYQWQLFILCGFGWFADNMWMQGISVAIPGIQREFNVPDSWMGLGTSAAFVGMIVGASFWGPVSDIIGRRPAFTMTLLIAAFFGTAAS